MALRDTWHRALVYFGLAEEHGYEEGDELYEPEYEPEPRERGRDRAARRLGAQRRPAADDFDDIFAEDEPIVGEGRGRPARTVEERPASTQMHLVVPRNFNDAQQVADQFKRSQPVVLNLQTTAPELSKRLIDFASGLTYALDGGMQRIAEKVFLLTPRNVHVSDEEKARLVEEGLFE